VRLAGTASKTFLVILQADVKLVGQMEAGEKKGG
jgi:hypothetical protein